MSQYCFDALNVIKTPVWLISPVAEDIIFANDAATMVMRDKPYFQCMCLTSKPNWKSSKY